MIYKWWVFQLDVSLQKGISKLLWNCSLLIYIEEDSCYTCCTWQWKQTWLGRSWVLSWGPFSEWPGPISTGNHIYIYVLVVFGIWLVWFTVSLCLDSCGYNWGLNIFGWTRTCSHHPAHLRPKFHLDSAADTETTISTSQNEKNMQTLPGGTPPMKQPSVLFIRGWPIPPVGRCLEIWCESGASAGTRDAACLCWKDLEDN
jgi:hypothetical protein